MATGMSMMIPMFFSALTIGFSGAMMPGSLLTCTIRQSLKIGKCAGFQLVSGHLVLEVALIGLIFLGCWGSCWSISG